MSYSEQQDDKFDVNGNLYQPEDPKGSVLQILTDTLRRPSVGLNSTDQTKLPDKDYTSVDILNENINSEDSGSNISFNPGDKLSCSVPPLARQHISENQLDPSNDSTEPKVCPSYTITQPKCPTRLQFKQCHLTTVLGSARRCFKQLSAVKEGLASLMSKDEQLSQGKKVTTAGPDYALIATLGEYILFLTRQAFTPAHRLYTASLGLHMSEDLIRNPNDPTLLNFKEGYISRPNWNSIIHTQMKLRSCVDSATEMYHRFGQDGNTWSLNQQMQQILVTLMHAFQDLYATALGSTDIFKVLLHIEDYGEKILQEFLLSLESLERSDLLVQVQALRRSFDDIVIMMEQLSWVAHIVYRLANGKSLTPSPDDSTLKIPISSSDGSNGQDDQLSKVQQSQSRLDTNCRGRSTGKPSVTRSRSRTESTSGKSHYSSQSGKRTDDDDYSHQLVRSQSRHGRKGSKTGEYLSSRENRGNRSNSYESSTKSTERRAKSYIPTPTTPQSASRKTSPKSTRPHTPEQINSNINEYGAGGSYSHHHIHSNSSNSSSNGKLSHHSHVHSSSSRENKKYNSNEYKNKSRKNKSQSHGSSRDHRNSSKDKIYQDNQHSSSYGTKIPSQSNSNRIKDVKHNPSSNHKRSRTFRDRDRDEQETVVKFGSNF